MTQNPKKKLQINVMADFMYQNVFSVRNSEISHKCILSKQLSFIHVFAPHLTCASINYFVKRAVVHH